MDPYYPDAAVLERRKAEPAPQAKPTTAATLEAPVQRIIQVSGRTKLRSVRLYVTGTDQLVTTIEILPPVNKRPGEGLEAYRRKRLLILQSPVHLLEIDLLRGGERPGSEINQPPLETDYILLLNRGDTGDYRLSEIWPVALNEALPLLPVPLLSPDPDVTLDLGAATQSVYARAGYDWRIDYHQSVPPPELRPEMTLWLREHLPEVASSG
jgi:hypothetical protein